jgi:hypothetical protein
MEFSEEKPCCVCFVKVYEGALCAWNTGTVENSWNKNVYYDLLSCIASQNDRLGNISCTSFHAPDILVQFSNDLQSHKYNKSMLV